MAATEHAAAAGASTRERLVAAAIAVFVADGYEQARVQDIARAAGMTTGAIYANYRDKGELLFDAIGARANAEVDALLQDHEGRDARELLGIVGDRVFEPRAQPPLLLDALANSRRDSELATLLRERFHAREALIGEIVEQGKRDGSIDRELDTDSMARLCMVIALGAIAARTVDLERPDAGAWHVLVERLLDACAPSTKDQQHES